MSRYLIALGSNVRHAHYGAPAAVLRAALAAVDEVEFTVERVAPVLSSAPVGPSRRRYANTVAVVETALEPIELIVELKRIERAFGRRGAGRRWSARVLDLDIVLWSGGAWSSPGLTVPHPVFRTRTFVLTPALAIAPDWRDPLTGLTLRQLHGRLIRPRPRGA